MAPEVGLEPTTLRLTAECSAIELLRNIFLDRRETHALFSYNKSGMRGQRLPLCRCANIHWGANKAFQTWGRVSCLSGLGIEEDGDVVGRERAVPRRRAGSDYGLVIFA